MPREDVAHILCDIRHVVAEELESGLEVPETQDKMERDRERARPDELLLGVAEFEVGMPVFVGKARQRIQFIDFGAGKDREAVRGGHEVFCS
jgi:hypothetical protein